MSLITYPVSDHGRSAASIERELNLIGPVEANGRVITVYHWPCSDDNMIVGIDHNYLCESDRLLEVFRWAEDPDRPFPLRDKITEGYDTPALKDTIYQMVRDYLYRKTTESWAMRRLSAREFYPYPSDHNLEKTYPLKEALERWVKHRIFRKDIPRYRRNKAERDKAWAHLDIHEKPKRQIPEDTATVAFLNSEHYKIGTIIIEGIGPADLYRGKRQRYIDVITPEITTGARTRVCRMLLETGFKLPLPDSLANTLLFEHVHFNHQLYPELLPRLFRALAVAGWSVMSDITHYEVSVRAWRETARRGGVRIVDVETQDFVRDDSGDPVVYDGTNFPKSSIWRPRKHEDGTERLLCLVCTENT